MFEMNCYYMCIFGLMRLILNHSNEWNFMDYCMKSGLGFTLGNWEINRLYHTYD